MTTVRQPIILRYRIAIRRWLTQHTPQLLRIAIILGVLTFSLAQAYIGLPPLLSLILMALPVALGGIILLLRQPELGLLLLIAATMLLKYRLPPLDITIPLVLGLTGLWLLEMIARRRQIVLIRSRVIQPSVALVVVAIVSFGFGQIPWYPVNSAPLDAQIGGLFIFITSIAALLWVAHQVHEIRWLEYAVYLFLAIGGLYMVARLLAPVWYGLIQLFNRGMVGSVFWVWLTALSLSLGLLHTQLPMVWRVAILSIGGATLLVAFGQTLSWTSGWMPPLVSIGVILLIGWPRFMIPVTGITILSSPFLLPLVSQIIYVGDNTYSQITRLAAWEIVFQIAKVNPILGLGPANYSWYTPLFPIMGWYVNFNSHNNYVDLIAQTGLVGLVVYFWLMAELGWLCWRLLKRVPPGGFAYAFVVASLGGLAGTVFSGMLGDWVLPYVYNIGVDGMRASILAWLFLGGMLVLEQLYGDKPEIEDVSSSISAEKLNYEKESG